MTEQIDLPAPNTYPSGEKEWSFATQDEDGWVNLDKVLEFSLARYSDEFDGYLSFAEGVLELEFAEQFGLALLAAVKIAREKK
ncbi:hypothetical protein [Tsukamurella paurometabola]|uniref:Uncharacterized protein n=1 Tax=Tsukamurella paurometabola TaxID=2061 RepID=A0ABS5NEY2_TSUPA|nr:hypothetical protein [Tsukamurella paurometabola]MBS4102432.1 hypothetical protein [Tsukamurella paurometabola]